MGLLIGYDIAPLSLLKGMSERWTGDTDRARSYLDAALAMVEAERQRGRLRREDDPPQLNRRYPEEREAWLTILEGWIHAASGESSRLVRQAE